MAIDTMLGRDNPIAYLEEKLNRLKSMHDYGATLPRFKENVKSQELLYNLIKMYRKAIIDLEAIRDIDIELKKEE